MPIVKSGEFKTADYSARFGGFHAAGDGAEVDVKAVTNARDIWRYTATLRDGTVVKGVFAAPSLTIPMHIKAEGCTPDNPVVSLAFERVAVEVQPHVVRRP